MDSLTAAIAPKLVVPAGNSHFSGGRLLGKPLLRPTSNRISKKIRVHAEKTTPIDFGDPDWKSKFRKDFEARFNIPHLTDVFHDAVPIPSTFCLKMRTPTKDFADGYPSDETWHGYINNNDRVLLKMTSVGDTSKSITQPEAPNAEVTTATTASSGLKASRKKPAKSDVWEHVTKIDKEDGSKANKLSQRMKKMFVEFQMHLS